MVWHRYMSTDFTVQPPFQKSARSKISFLTDSYSKWLVDCSEFVSREPCTSKCKDGTTNSGCAAETDAYWTTEAGFIVLKQIILAAALSLGVVGSAQAALTLTPADIQSGDCTGPGTGADPAWITNFCAAMSGLTQQYKIDAPAAAESGPLAAHYSGTLTTESPGDFDGGTITWTGPSSIVCSPTSACWLLVKDGNHTPGRYAFDLSNRWDGVMEIILADFWPASEGGGSISHVAIYSEEVDLPAPAAVVLLGVALLGLQLRRK